MGQILRERQKLVLMVKRKRGDASTGRFKRSPFLM
jgi:hypothetical protein